MKHSQVIVNFLHTHTHTYTFFFFNFFKPSIWRFIIFFVVSWRHFVIYLIFFLFSSDNLFFLTLFNLIFVFISLVPHWVSPWPIFHVIFLKVYVFILLGFLVFGILFIKWIFFFLLNLDTSIKGQDSEYSDINIFYLLY